MILRYLSFLLYGIASFVGYAVMNAFGLCQYSWHEAMAMSYGLVMGMGICNYMYGRPIEAVEKEENKNEKHS